MQKTILVVEDELVVANDIRLTLERAGYTVIGIARSFHSAMETINNVQPGLVLLDIFLKGDLTGIDLATELNKKDIPFVYLSANCNSSVLEMAKVTQPSGFIVKPFREKDLLVTLDIARYRHDFKQQMAGSANASQPAHSRRAATGNFASSAPAHSSAAGPSPAGTAGSSQYVPESPGMGLPGIIGQSPGMLRIFQQVKEVGPLDTSVLILGESGTGKEGIASNIHNLSPRRSKPFVKLNCAALPPNLVESELFGHEKGAFTGAFERRIGKFEQANGGTLFLDEIGEMPPSLQVKLLRVLQEREIERLGGRETIKVNVRIIAATNANLEKGIAEGRFRLDLYYRLNVFPIILPPLRQRKEDIPLLVAHFIKMYAQKAGRHTESIAGEALARLMDYAWPGNVRELQNVIERSILLSNDPVLRDVSFIGSTPRSEAPAEDGNPVKTIAQMERDHILTVLRQCKGRVSGPGGAAELLNLPASTLKSKMKKLGIEKSYKI
ncbi:MAG TPA: sigma-54 dependent transcriptional regulator [Puia sp.]|uniref:sigma-54 dependent transcriptional regulator n=1 Tax=Puia sp. TaxID=2045100 RepID=UPI002C6169D0|nr:sigma-54 dependent transcriptional regulator [Puia sp.]HVU98461.1 sigma-54 dependent transcriptional regulator [Puia sp.]